LDQDFGFFPHVTRSNTTSKNALEIMAQCNLANPQIYYVMRSYLTRHGNGYMPGESEMILKNNEMETNRQHDWQGKFRTGYHSKHLLTYSLDCDSLQHKQQKYSRNLVISCLDQTDGKIMLDDKAMDMEEFLHDQLPFDPVEVFYSEDGISLKKEDDLSKTDYSFKILN
jgi:adenylosuccinate synthase